MPYFRGLNSVQLEAEIESVKADVDRLGQEHIRTSNLLVSLQGEVARRRSTRPMTVPFWALEVLSAHARKRYENITRDHRTSTYAQALDVATNELGREIWPRDIPGEHHGCTPLGARHDKR